MLSFDGSTRININIKKGETFFQMDPESRSLLIIFIILVFFSAFFSCTESAVSLMNKIRIKNMADDGNKRAKKALFVSNNFENDLEIEK